MTGAGFLESKSFWSCCHSLSSTKPSALTYLLFPGQGWKDGVLKTPVSHLSPAASSGPLGVACRWRVAPSAETTWTEASQPRSQPPAVLPMVQAENRPPGQNPWGPSVPFAWLWRAPSLLRLPWNSTGFLFSYPAPPASFSAFWILSVNVWVLPFFTAYEGFLVFCVWIVLSLTYGIAI